jgi:hypothetical protein
MLPESGLSCAHPDIALVRGRVPKPFPSDMADPYQSVPEAPRIGPGKRIRHWEVVKGN